MIARVAGVLLILLFAGSTTLNAQTARPGPRPAGKGRAIGTVVGAAAGFGAGLLIGLASFDDAVNSERKIWTLTAVMTASGAAGGYVAADRLARRRRRSPAPGPGSPVPAGSAMTTVLRGRGMPHRPAPAFRGLFSVPLLAGGPFAAGASHEAPEVRAGARHAYLRSE